MNHLPLSARLNLTFPLAGFLFSVWLNFVQGGRAVGILVGLWVPSTHSLGTLRLSPVEVPAGIDRARALVRSEF